MKQNQGPLSGFRDMLPEQMLPREQMIQKIKTVFERYGYSPLETPAIERYETLAGKYGEEGKKLMYRFRDHGNRDVALRYDLTVPLARVVAQHRDKIPLPFKRYQIGPVWRGESPQAGRYREFYQFDADVVGSKSPMADAEVVMMMCDIFKSLEVNAVVRVNNRRILDGLAEVSGIKDTKEARKLISIIDKTDKFGVDYVLKEIESQFGGNVSELVSKYLSIEGTPSIRLERIRQILENNNSAEEGISNLKTVFSILEAAGYKEPLVIFDQKIARGLDYYTGIIFETTLTNLPNIGSVCSGGRYDNLIATLSDNKVDLPAVGTSVGVDRLLTALQTLRTVETIKTPSQILIVNFGEELSGEYAQVASNLRSLGIPTEVYYEGAKLAKQLKYADSLGIPWALFMGPDEIKAKVVKIKNLKTGEQFERKLEDLVDLLKN
ncbi:MAG: histidine--tRNA ligase [Patescibacteria group bacterium]|nr:MAG: histidine--tRNA ligase [Patescibacteria group bacterium]